uniref:Uncharacterized protein n=1 Tax=Setaria italica TaxID=4555 RepID=K4ALW7_SETIT
MVIEEGRVLKDLPALKRWLQAFAVMWKRPYKVLHSYAQCRYTVVYDKKRCPWRVCARKQNIIGKWKITKVVGAHNCANHELTVKHRQLTSTLIAKRMMGILKEQPNMKVRTIIRTIAEIYGGYVTTYGKAWRAKQRAWQMIYGDWESGYEQLPEKQIFGCAFWCFPQCVEAFRHCRPVFSVDGMFFIGKYRGTLLAISCDANNMLVPLAFALVERENNDSWEWFLRLVRIHVVEPSREVGVVSDRHQGILNAVQEQIEGYPPLHHRWCTRHLAENLLWKDGVKDNFELFQVAARQLEDYYFQRKLEQVRSATNAEDLDKWTRSHDTSGWRYEFQCSNMAKSFNKLLLGICGMPMNAIAQFTFYRLVAWFNERHAKAEALQSAGERWAEKPKRHLSIANERAATHEVQCFDLTIGTYQVEHRDGTTSNGEIQESRIHVPRQYHFVCSHVVVAARHRNFDIESMIPHEFSVETLVRTWSPRFVPFRDPREWPSYDGPKYIVDPAYHWNKCGSRKRTRHKMTMDQKMLGLSIRGNSVIGPCVSKGWRARVAAFLGREVEDQGARTSGVLISWLWEHFGHCPQHADAETVGHYCKAWIMYLFVCVGQYSWGSAMLCFLYRQLCKACHRTSASASVGGCVYLLQLWMWARLPVGRPEAMGRRLWFLGQTPRRQPMWAYLWDQVKVGHTRLERAYLDYINELDMLTAYSLNWQPYEGEGALPFAVSVMCVSDDDLYRMKCPLVCFYAVEFHMPDRVARQFGIRQIWPTPAISTRVELHK